MAAPGSDLALRCARQRRTLVEAGAAERELAIVVSPYRVCPIGAHSDHQHAPVLATAIDAHTVLSFAPAPGAEVALSSENFPGVVRFDLRAPETDAGPAWGRYARAAAWACASGSRARRAGCSVASAGRCRAEGSAPPRPCCSRISARSRT